MAWKKKMRDKINFLSFFFRNEAQKDNNRTKRLFKKKKKKERKEKKRQIFDRSIAQEMAGKNMQLKTMGLKFTKQTGCKEVSDDTC